MKPGYQERIAALGQAQKLSVQVNWGWAFLLLNLGLIVFLLNYATTTAYLWFFGLLFGFVLQRSRFCFAAAFRDIFLIGNTAITRALVIGLIVGTCGFLFLEILTPGTALLASMGKVKAVGIFTMAGALLFGFGMVIAGGCATGMLMRMGEGYLMQWVAMLGFLVGSSVGAYHLGWWMTAFGSRAQALFIPAIFGWPLAIALQLIVLGAIYLWALGHERGWKTTKASIVKLAQSPRSLVRSPANPHPGPEKQPKSLYQVFFKKPWPYVLGAILLATLNTALFSLWGSPWAITSGITYFSAWVSQGLGLSPESWYYFQNILLLEAREGKSLLADPTAMQFLHSPMVYHFMAIIAGSLLASLAAGEFRLRKWKSGRFVIAALVGGFLMGYGARLALGCNIGAFFSAIPSFSVHGWVFGIFTLLGAYVGGKVLLRFLVV